MRYPANFKPAPGGAYVVSFRDIPEAITQGDDEADAADMAADALLTAMEFYFEDGRPVPAPSEALDGERMIALPLSTASKVLLLNEMLAQRVRPSELARRLGTSNQDVNRLTDLKHPTKIDRIGQAMSALGRELGLVVK
jgi:antitoxin HicB